MERLSHAQMVEAMTNNRTELNGRFWVGVHSTKIYCLPSCPARLPLLKNVIFYDNREDAIAAGLRGCKRCKSDTYPDILPGWYAKIVRYMADHPSERLTEPDLAEMAGVEISTVRRLFKNNLKITPLAFHRKLRLKRAASMIADGESYIGAAYECGWESVSAFRDAYKKQFGSFGSFGSLPGGRHA
jgi:AraC family transcriptional regulator of adaptative response/methylated-DNA-[protein]-cysteine methyltransferase